MELSGVTSFGPATDDQEILNQLPESLRSLLKQINGFVLFGGALHVRGACHGPSWHSLRQAWSGEAAFHRLYPSVNAGWIPFAEDCVGDQYLLVDGAVMRLNAETGEIVEPGMTLRQFLEAAVEDPIGSLEAEPLIRFQKETGDLPEGKLILVYPPFCTVEAENGVHLSAVDATELHKYHAQLAAAWPPDGGQLTIEIVE